MTELITDPIRLSVIFLKQNTLKKTYIPLASCTCRQLCVCVFAHVATVKKPGGFKSITEDIYCFSTVGETIRVSASKLLTGTTVTVVSMYVFRTK